MAIIKPDLVQENQGRVKREEFTPLGQIYYVKAQLWQRIKIETELLAELNVSKHSLRAYMVTTPAYRMRPDMKVIILRTLPEAAECFLDPRPAKQKKSI